VLPSRCLQVMDNLLQLDVKSPIYDVKIQGTKVKTTFYKSMWIMQGSEDQSLEVVYTTLYKILQFLITEQQATTIYLPLVGAGEQFKRWNQMTSVLFDLNEYLSPPQKSNLKFILYTNRRETLHLLNKTAVVYPCALVACLPQMLQMLQSVPRLMNKHINMSLSIMQSALKRNVVEKEEEDTIAVVAGITQLLGSNARLVIEQVLKETVRWYGNEDLTKRIKEKWQIGDKIHILREYTNQLPKQNPQMDALMQNIKILKRHGNFLQHSDSFWYLSELDPMELVQPLVNILQIGQKQGILQIVH